MKKLNQKGFSLIELMVVVAIIAILATIAIPAYQDFQAKARQKEAPSLLSGYFVAAQAAKVEHGGYAGNFVAIGFNPAGELKYRVIAVDNSTNVQLGAGATDVSCVTTETPATNCSDGSPSWTEMVGSTTANKEKIGAVAEDSSANANVKAKITSSTFIVTASGVVNVKAVRKTDMWSMDEKKTIKNTCNGIKSGGTVTCATSL